MRYVFRDWVEYAYKSYGIAQIPEIDGSEYKKECDMILNKYQKANKKADIKGLMDKALLELKDELDNDKQSYLGEFYMRMNANFSGAGQFFTPHHIGIFMAEMSIGSGDDVDGLIKEKGYISTSDSSCGAGVLLLAFANVFEKKYPGYDLSDNVFLYGGDIDINCCYMTLLQLSLANLSGIICHGDSLDKNSKKPEYFTPAFLKSNLYELIFKKS